MEDILELIFALVAGFLWLFGGSLFKKREEDEYPESTVLPKEKRQRGNQKSDDEEARQREIRESILRKISERRQQSEPEPTVIFEPQYQESYTEPQEMDEPLFSEESVKEEAAEVPVSWNTDGGTYEQEMQERLEEIEATKRRAEALKQKAKKVTQKHYAVDHEKSTQEKHVLSVGSVRTSLKSPENVRAAFLYAEILGKPVGLRNSEESRSGF